VSIDQPTGKYALCDGQLALVGLDGSGERTVTFRSNTSTVAQPVQGPNGTVNVAANTFQFIGSDVKFGVTGVLEVTGTLALTRQPNGTLDIALVNAGVSIFLGGDDPAITLNGNAAFQISLSAASASKVSASMDSLFETPIQRRPWRKLRPTLDRPRPCSRPQMWRRLRSEARWITSRKSRADCCRRSIDRRDRGCLQRP
jgi:hypothetical protein